MAKSEAAIRNAGTSTSITNVFVLMLENHSFDHIFAMSGIPGIRAATVADSNTYCGNKYFVTNGAPSSMTTDPGHEFADVVEQLYANNSGFASNYATSLSEDTGTPSPDRIGDIMACFHTEKQLPVIYQLAREFAICDNWFSSMPGPTWPNRFFVHGASSAGLDRSPTQSEEVEWESHLHGFRFQHGSIFQALTKAGHTWRLYNDSHNRYREHSEWLHGGWIPQVASLMGISVLDVHPLDSSRNSSPWADRFASDLQGEYPYAYTFIEPNFGKSFFDKVPPYKGPTYKAGSSQHPEDDPYGGECLVKAVYEAIRNSPVWNTSLLVIVYDEHGGFYDCVKPSAATPPGDDNVNGLQCLNGFDFSQYGIRVPAVIVSPLIPKGTVDHTLYDHASIPATLERMLGMEPLTERDRCANDLRALLAIQEPREDGDCPRTLASPVPPAQIFTEETITEIDQPLPESGNWIGFMQILLKTELEMSRTDEKAQAEILQNYRKITTASAAKAYIQSIGAKIETERKKSE
jgi:phospholipase C